MDSSLTPISPDLNYKTADCLSGILLSDLDRNIFWIGGTFTLLATFFVILGCYKFKELRKQPGDLIVGIALSDFALSLHWIIIATWYTAVDNETFCTINGAIGVFAGTNEFLYNVSFSLYLIIGLRNALKQVKIPKKAFHVINITLSLFLLINLLVGEEVGKTLSGTCSLKAKCSEGISLNSGPIIAGFYAAVGFYTYYYVKKNITKCRRAHSKRTGFLLYYLRYIVASTIIYMLIAIMGLAISILIRPKDLKKDRYNWINSMFNIVKLCSPLVLSFIRYNDPVIRKFMLKTVMFWTWEKKKPVQEKAEPLIKKDLEKHFELHMLTNLRGAPTNRDHKQSVDSNSSRGSFGNEFTVNALSATRKEEITYTLLSCILYANQMEHQNSLGTVQTYERKALDPYKHQVVCLVEEEEVLSAMPFLQRELDRVKYNILPGTLKIYSPEIFSGFLLEERDYLDIYKSLDFNANRKQIRSASGGEGGKSGEFFFFSADKKLLIKTIPDSEMKMLINILEEYQQHFRQYPNSLISKIFGAFTYENTDEGLKYNLVVMKNVCGFPSKYIERVYDLKGSKFERETLVGQEVVGKAGLKNHVLKDIDFERFEQKLHLRTEFAQKFLEQIQIDSDFFRRNNLIDYSLIVFIVNKGKFKNDVGFFDDFTLRNRLASIESTEERGIFYNMGIIDYLQPYTIKKVLEKYFKRLKTLDPDLETSTQDPDYYSERFINFVRSIVGWL